MQDKSRGKYASLSLLDAQGNELKKHYVSEHAPCIEGVGRSSAACMAVPPPGSIHQHPPRAPRPATSSPTVNEVWVQAQWGGPFKIKVKVCARLLAPRAAQVWIDS